MQIAKKDCPLLLVEVRIIKGGKLIEWLPVLFSRKASDRGVRGFSIFAAFQMRGERVRENWGRAGKKTDE